MDLILFASAEPARAAMAAAVFNALVDPAVACAIAATPDPSRPFDDATVKVMDELEPGVLLLRASRLTRELGAEAAQIIELGRLPIPAAPASVPTSTWEIADPSGQPTAGVRQIRDAIHARIERFLRDRNWLRSGCSSTRADPAV
jgi:protein-tyrosine-phosphatase